jgi:hypothetical protein
MECELGAGLPLRERVVVELLAPGWAGAQRALMDRSTNPAEISLMDSDRHQDTDARRYCTPRRPGPGDSVSGSAHGTRGADPDADILNHELVRLRGSAQAFRASPPTARTRVTSAFARSRT